MKSGTPSGKQARRPGFNAGGQSRTALVRLGLTQALKTRQRLELPIHEAICAYDAAAKLGIELRFDAIPSMEGMYIKKSQESGAPHIIVSALRPAGRQSMTTAHEIGHHVFGHGTRIDQYVAGAGTVGSALLSTDDSNTAAGTIAEPEEVLADSFGAFFLMPKSAVERGFAVRGVKASEATALDVFQVSGWLGVGYTTLVHHLCLSLRLIPWSRAQQLIAVKPKSLREQLLGEPTSSDVFVVDSGWTGRPVDLQVGDFAIIPPDTAVEPTTGKFADVPAVSPGTIGQTVRGHWVFQATSVGLGRLVGDGWAAFVRVSVREYFGRNLYRYYPPLPDDE